MNSAKMNIGGRSSLSSLLLVKHHFTVYSELGTSAADSAFARCLEIGLQFHSVVLSRQVMHKAKGPGKENDNVIEFFENSLVLAH